MRIGLLGSLLLSLAIGCATTPAPHAATKDAPHCVPSAATVARDNARLSPDPSATYQSPLPVVTPGPSVTVEATRSNPQVSVTDHDPACAPGTTDQATR